MASVSSSFPVLIRGGRHSPRSRAPRYRGGEAGDAVDAGGLPRLGQAHRWQEGGAAPRQASTCPPQVEVWSAHLLQEWLHHGRSRSFWRSSMAGCTGGTAGKGRPPDCLVRSQYLLGPRGLTCPPSGGWPAGVELEPPGVVQADTHKTTATTTTRMTRFHHVGIDFQVDHIVVPS